MLDLYKDTPALEEVVNQTGYKTLQSLMFLYHLVKEMNPNFILELGTGFGCSAIFMALALGKGQICSVDDYRGDASLNIRIPQGNLEKCNVAGKVILVEEDARHLWTAPYPISLVFMDASHNKADLFSEYAAIEGRLFESHIIVIDDLFSADVKEFPLELFKKDCYDICFMPKFHYGMAVLSPYKFQNEILAAITKGAGDA